ncbi:MAG: hypothetical protein H0X39_00880 [Actinobacteria bacterium]|nr:hypothetical protein [Actinomycetota bacterium]
MSYVILPVVTSDPNHRIQTTIKGVAYLIDFRWNARDVAWYMDIYDGIEQPIRCGIKIVIGTFLGRSCSIGPFADGAFIAFDATGKGKDAGFDDLGARVKIAYLTSADLLQYYGLVGVT